MKPWRIIAGVFVIVLLIVGIVLHHIFIDEKVITLIPTNGTTMTFGLADNAEESQSIKTVLLKTTEQASIRVSKGSYLVEISGDRNHNPVYQSLPVTDHDEHVSTPKLTFTPDYLENYLQEQRVSIIAAAQRQASTDGFTFSSDQLSEDGTWYSAKLTPSDPLTTDTEQIILHFTGNAWNVAAQPAIVFYAGDYPNIPATVIRSINNR